MSDLASFSALVKQRNEVDRQLAAAMGRAATTGHIGEYIAAQVFDIALMPSAAHKTIDGHFRLGPLARRSVNVKFYAKQEGLLDFTPEAHPDFFLVLAGPKGVTGLLRDQHRPLLVDRVFLFDAARLVSELRATGVKIGVGTSVRQHWWERAEIYPNQVNLTLPVSAEQKAILGLFR